MKLTLERWRSIRAAAVPVLFIGSCLAGLPAAAQECEVKIGTVGPMVADFQRLMKAPIPDNALRFNAQIVAENLLRAISLAGTDQDGEKIAAELRKMIPESRYLGKAGWRGRTQFGSNQEFSFPVGLNFIADGKLDKQLKLEIAAE
jgi:hypothetical protein